MWRWEIHIKFNNFPSTTGFNQLALWFRFCDGIFIFVLLFRGATPRNNIFKMFVLILFLYPLHVSAPVGHPQVGDGN
jgi:hypothetical protein